MKLINSLILRAFNPLKNERTIYAIYHLFTGRPSIQTLQDAHLYELASFYGIYKKLTLNDFNKAINELEDKKILKQLDETNRYMITEKGFKLIETNELPLKFKGLAYEQITDEFYQRLLLFIQVWTNSNKKNTNYIPIVDNYKVENFIKQLYRKRRSHVQIDLNKLYEELSILLIKVPDELRFYYIERLSGYAHYGLSIPQLALKYETDKHAINLSITSINQILIDSVINQPNKYKMLYSLLSDLLTLNRLTKSASDTYELFKRQNNLQTIADARNLKLSTIYDHVVEIALYNQEFPIIDFVPSTTQKEIIKYVSEHKTFKIKEIKDNLPSEITYFQIRLVLSMMSRIKVSE